MRLPTMGSAARLGRLALLLGAAPLTSGSTAAAQPVAPPLQLPPSACTTTQLSVSLVTSEGAAGTILDTLQLANSSVVTCTVQGFVTVQMLDAMGNPLPTNDVLGGGILARPPGPAPIMLAPGAAAPFGLAWSDVTVDGETSCPTSSTLAITPPGESTPLLLALEIAPCGSGTIDVGALRPPGGSVL